MTIEKIEELVNAIGLKAKSSANSLAYSDPEKKRRALLNAALSVLDNKTIILEANKEDIERSINKDLSEAMLDRLKLNEDRVNGISNGLVEIANLTDPVGKILDEWIQPTGLNIKRVQTPLILELFIYFQILIIFSISLIYIYISYVQLGVVKDKANYMNTFSYSFFGIPVISRLVGFLISSKRPYLGLSILTLIPSGDAAK